MAVLLVSVRRMISAVSPELGDIHFVSNGLVDRASISIHLHCGNIGTLRRTGRSRSSSPAIPWRRRHRVAALHQGNAQY
jgi:predicted metal-dependent enzyme (double-stranded beta helix superfamily)